MSRLCKDIDGRSRKPLHQADHLEGRLSRTVTMKLSHASTTTLYGVVIAILILEPPNISRDNNDHVTLRFNFQDAKCPAFK